MAHNSNAICSMTVMMNAVLLATFFASPIGAQIVLPPGYLIPTITYTATWEPIDEAEESSEAPTDNATEASTSAPETQAGTFSPTEALTMEETTSTTASTTTGTTAPIVAKPESEEDVVTTPPPPDVPDTIAPTQVWAQAWTQEETESGDFESFCINDQPTKLVHTIPSLDFEYHVFYGENIPTEAALDSLTEKLHGELTREAMTCNLDPGSNTLWELISKTNGTSVEPCDPDVTTEEGCWLVRASATAVIYSRDSEAQLANHLIEWFVASLRNLVATDRQVVNAQLQGFTNMDLDGSDFATQETKPGVEVSSAELNGNVLAYDSPFTSFGFFLFVGVAALALIIVTAVGLARRQQRREAISKEQVQEEYSMDESNSTQKRRSRNRRGRDYDDPEGNPGFFTRYQRRKSNPAFVTEEC